MHKIYNNSWVTGYAALCANAVVARGTEFIAKNPRLQNKIEDISGEKIIDVERDIDNYAGYAVVAAEVGRPNLSPSQHFANKKDPRYKDTKDFYLVTMVTVDPDPKTGKRRQREFIFDAAAYKELGVEKPTVKKPVGDNTSVISDRHFTIGAKGQYSFGVVPRAHEVSAAKTSLNENQIDDIETALNSEKKPSRMFKVRFMDPSSGPKPK